jgi:ATP-binding cassette subfamily C protein
LFAKTPGATSADLKPVALRVRRGTAEPIIAISLASGSVGNVLELDMSHQFIIVLVLIRLIGSFKDLQNGFHRMARTKSKYLATVNLINEIELIREDTGGGRAPNPLLGVEFRNVTFTYGKDARVLRRANFRIEGNQLTTLVGASGAGKSTVLDLVLGLLSPRGGEVVLGGVPREEVDLTRWRRQIGYVPQETFLFHDSVANNITLGEPGHTSEEVWQALREACADEFVAALPNKLDHDVGERGLALSGGQRQRIALARALLHKPLFLILDEATAALDIETERTICERIKEMSSQTGLTVLAVSHSQEWARVADRVILLGDHGVSMLNEIEDSELDVQADRTLAHAAGRRIW